MKEQFEPQTAVAGQESMSVIDVIIQLSELSCRMDELEEHWNDPEALRSRLGELAAAQPARRWQPAELPTHGLLERRA
jgi:hypothetical protein